MRFVLRRFPRIDLSALREAFRTFGPTLSDQKPRLVAALGLALTGTLFELLRPWPIKFVLDNVLFSDDPGLAVPWGRIGGDTLLIACALGVVAVAAGIGGMSVLTTVAVAQIGRKIAQRIRRMVFEHLHRLALPFHENQRTGDLLVRLMGDVNMVRDLLFASWVAITSRGSVLLGTAVIMFALDPRLALVAAIPLPFLVVGVRRTSKELTTITKKQRRLEGDTAAFAAETLNQVRLVKSYAAESRTARVFARSARSTERAGVKAARAAAKVGMTAEVLTGFGLALVLFVGARGVMSGTLTAGELVVVLSYTRAFYKPLRKLARESVRLAKAQACASRLLEVLRLEPESDGSGEPAPEFRGHVEYQGVVVEYPDGRTGLAGIDLEVRAGELAVISGPNGAGKTTLLSVLLRLLTPKKGRVLVDGAPIERFELTSFRDRIAYVPQQNLLFGATVRDNILFGRPDATDDEVRKAARIALAEEFIEELPDGFDTMLGENGASLSGGEQRRIVLARAALRNASILCFDEPLESLDPESRSLVAQAIRRMTRGRTALVVSHGAAAELSPDVSIAMEAGRIRRIDRASLMESRS